MRVNKSKRIVKIKQSKNNIKLTILKDIKKVITISSQDNKRIRKKRMKRKLFSYKKLNLDVLGKIDKRLIRGPKKAFKRIKLYQIKPFNGMRKKKLPRK